MLYKQTPTWVIDWVNKIFTFVNNIDFIDDLWVDNVVYNNYTINNNIITLLDAPTISIFADYEPSNSITPITTEITFWDIKSKVWYLLWQKPTSTIFSTDIVWEEINRTCLKVLRWRVKNKLNWQTLRAWDLWFMNWNFTLNTKAWWITTEITEINATTIKTNTDNLLNSGFIMLWWDIIQYTWKTATELTWVSGVISQNLIWSKIIQLYEVPTTFDLMIWLQKVIQSYDWIRYHDIDLNSWYISYEILKNWNVSLLKINWLEYNSKVKIKYVKKYVKLSDDSDICVLPNDYGIDVLSYLVAWNLAYDKGMPTSERLLNSWYANLQEMYQYFTNETKVIRQKLMPKPYWFNSIR